MLKKNTTIFYLVLLIFSCVIPYINTNITQYYSEELSIPKDFNYSKDLQIASDKSIDLIEPPEKFFVESTVPINVIFIGFDSDIVNTTYIGNNLKSVIKPTFGYQSASDIDYAGGIYNIDYSFYFSTSTTLAEDLASYLDSIETNIAPPGDLLTYNATATSAKQHSAVNTINWLDNNINNYFPEVNNSYCFYLIDLYTYDYVQDYHYYSIDFKHPDTGTPSDYNYTILYGGEFPNRGVFLDLSAGPIYYMDWIPPEIPNMKVVSPVTIPPIWNYTFPLNKTDFNNNMIEYIRKITDFIYLPCYIYEPILPEEFDNIRIVIFDNTTNYEISNNPEEYINTTIIKNTFDEIIPDSNWNVTVLPEYLYHYPELEQIILEAQNHPDIGPMRYENITNYLKAHYNELGIFEETIAVIILALPEMVMVPDNGTGAIALEDQLVIIDGGYHHPISYDNSYYSYLTIHEVGHEIGLFHPHDYVTFDENDNTTVYGYTDWLFDFISTPMTYAHYDTSFSTFDREAIARSHTFKYINKTLHLLYNANQTLLSKNYNELSPLLENKLNYVLFNKTLSIESFESEDFLVAHYYAKLCYLAAESYFIFVDGLGLNLPPTWNEVPSDQTIKLGEEFYYDVNASDIFGIKEYTINDTDNFNIDENGVIENMIVLDIGEYWVEIYAFDFFNNNCSAIIKIVVLDTIAPTWDIIPSDQTIELGEEFSYDVDASDISGIKEYTINDTGNFNINENGVIENVIMLDVGDYWVEIHAYNFDDKNCSAIIRITVVDTTIPIWSEIPLDQIFNIGEDFSYDVNASDLSNIDYYWIDDTVNFNIDSNTGLITNNTELEVDMYDLVIRAYDPYGNYCEETISIIVKPKNVPGFDLLIIMGCIFISIIVLGLYKKKKFL